MDGEAGNLYLQSSCGYRAEALRAFPNYSMEDVTQRLIDAISAKPRETVLVIGEYEARSVSSLYHAATGQHLGDLAVDKKVYAPRYPQAIVTSADDHDWTDAIRKAIHELFISTPTLIAEVYAEYIDNVLRETIRLRGGERDKVLAQLVFSDKDRLPGYVQLTRPDPSLTTETFKRELQRVLTSRLEALFEDMASADREKNVEQLLSRILPWSTIQEKLETIHSEIRQTLEAIRRIEERLRIV